MKILIELILLIVFTSQLYFQSATWTEINPPSAPSARVRAIISQLYSNEILLFRGNYDK